MADKPLFSLKFPGLPDKYLIDGISDDVKTALLQIASKVAYIDDQGATYYQALYSALYNTTWSITNTLSHCTSSNAAVSVTKGDSYTATITAATGYKMAGATVSITMGGTDITASAYNNGVITIAAVTGNLAITITAAAVELASISAVYTQSGTVYDTDSLDSLKTDLVVTATYDDASTATVPSADYTLSGTLTAGTSTITVSYQGQTAMFNVTVSEDTTAQIEYSGYVLEHKSGAVSNIVHTAVTNGGITIKYTMNEPTQILHPAGIIKYAGTVIQNAVGAMVVYDENDTIVNYVNEQNASTPNRWAQTSSTPTEYSDANYTLQTAYSKIAFSVDIRYLDDSYMYDYTTGQVWFAGRNTPYFGMSNVSEAQ